MGHSLVRNKFRKAAPGRTRFPGSHITARKPWAAVLSSRLCLESCQEVPALASGGAGGGVSPSEGTVRQKAVQMPGYT